MGKEAGQCLALGPGHPGGMGELGSRLRDVLGVFAANESQWVLRCPAGPPAQAAQLPLRVNRLVPHLLPALKRTVLEGGWR